MTELVTLADTATRTPEQARAWLVTLILAVLVAFLCLLFFLLATRLFRRGKRRRLLGEPTPTDSVWAAAGERVPVASGRSSDGEINLPAVEDVDAGDEPFWDAESEDDDGESWDGDADNDDADGDEPWR